MGIFDRKKPKEESTYDKMRKISDQINDIMSDKPDVGVLVMYDDGKEGILTCEGNSKRLEHGLLYSCQKDDYLKDLVLNVARTLTAEMIQNDPKAPQDLKDAIARVNTPGAKAEQIKLPGGESALAIHKDNIGSLSDSDIDDIIDGMLKKR